MSFWVRFMAFALNNRQRKILRGPKQDPRFENLLPLFSANFECVGIGVDTVKSRNLTVESAIVREDFIPCPMHSRRDITRQHNRNHTSPTQTRVCPGDSSAARR